MWFSYKTMKIYPGNFIQNNKNNIRNDEICKRLLEEFSYEISYPNCLLSSVFFLLLLLLFSLFEALLKQSFSVTITLISFCFLTLSCELFQDTTKKTRQNKTWSRSDLKVDQLLKQRNAFMFQLERVEKEEWKTKYWRGGEGKRTRL